MQINTPEMHQNSAARDNWTGLRVGKTNTLLTPDWFIFSVFSFSRIIVPSHGKQLTKIIIRMDVKSMQSQTYFLLSPLSARKIKGPTSLKSFCCASLPTFSCAERGANRTYVKCLVNLNVFFFTCKTVEESSWGKPRELFANLRSSP